MAKALDTNRTRLVFTGPDTGPTALAVEYSVVDGDMEDKGKRAEMDSPNFDSTSSAIWASAVGTVETAEEIS